MFHCRWYRPGLSHLQRPSRRGHAEDRGPNTTSHSQGHLVFNIVPAHFSQIQARCCRTSWSLFSRVRAVRFLQISAGSMTNFVLKLLLFSSWVWISGPWRSFPPVPALSILVLYVSDSRFQHVKIHVCMLPFACVPRCRLFSRFRT